MTFQNVATQSINIDGVDFYYRELGTHHGGAPLIFLNHLSATMDNCDPRIIDGIATEHHIIAFDNRGIGSTNGVTPTTVSGMADDAILFIEALGYTKVDIFGFSLGGFIAQEMLQKKPQLIRKVILGGTGPAGGHGIANMYKTVFKDVFKGFLTFRSELFYLFFQQNRAGKKAASQFLTRLKERTQNRDKKIKGPHLVNQLKAIYAWGKQKPQDLSGITHPIFIVNGDNDKMVPSSHSTDLAKRLSNAEVFIYKNSGHGAIFQYHDDFIKKALLFLRTN